jgi:hypothetical protein
LGLWILAGLQGDDNAAISSRLPSTSSASAASFTTYFKAHADINSILAPYKVHQDSLTANCDILLFSFSVFFSRFLAVRASCLNLTLRNRSAAVL